LKRGSRKRRPLTAGVFLLAILLFANPAFGRSYKSVLKEWTRQGRVHTLDNLEMKMSWHATYQASPMRKARLEKMAGLLEWSEGEQKNQWDRDEKDLLKFDEFFVAIYAGSSGDRSFGQETGLWRLVLETDGKRIEPTRFERAKISEIDRSLYPYLDKWSKGFWIRFPKSIRPDEPFSLRMLGVPAKSELVWK